MSPIADMDVHQTIVTAHWQRRAAQRRQKTLAGRLDRNPCDVRSPVLPLRHDNHDFAQPLYSSWRRHQFPPPVSLRPMARSSHWYMPQRPRRDHFDRQSARQGRAGAGRWSGLSRRVGDARADRRQCRVLRRNNGAKGVAAEDRQQSNSPRRGGPQRRCRCCRLCGHSGN